MTPETVFAKSAKGIQEIETRAHKLGSRLRQALILVDGIKTVDELVTDAGEMGETYQAHLEELAKLGFLTDISSDEAVVFPTTTPLSNKPAAPPPRRADAEPAPRPVEAAPAPKPAPPRAAPAPSPAAAKPAGSPAPVPAALKFAAAAQATKAAPAPEAVEYNSPIKWRMQDLLVDAMGLDTGRVGIALNQCRNREELARWVDHAVGPIEAAAGHAKAKVFYKTAKKLIGG